MEKQKISLRNLLCIAGAALLFAGLCVSIAFNVYQSFESYDSYLQSVDQIYVMEAGILRNNLEFRDGEDFDFRYDFAHGDYAELKTEYELENTARDGTEFDRALRLMHEYAPRLTHESYYDNHVPANALALLEYSLDNPKQGINCRAKAQILNEMYLALGIYARKVWIMPYSGYDTDCHVVNEIWDRTREKWIMLDVTNDEYWVDEEGAPLSVLEIREKAALREFCTPVASGDRTDDLQTLKNKRIGDFLYIVKNMVYMEYCTEYTAGESKDTRLLLPQNMSARSGSAISKSSAERSPIE